MFFCVKVGFVHLCYKLSQVVGCLAGEKPQMISAAVKGVARLTYEFSDLIASAYNLLPSTFLLLQRKNKEITKVSLSIFFKEATTICCCKLAIFSF